jgi:hypothetical protein
MLIKKSRWAAAALLSLASVAANADIIEFQFTGAITYGGNLAVIGDSITGKFSYDANSKPTLRVKNSYAHYSPPAPASMSITVGAHTVSSERLTVDIWNNYAGNVEDMVDVTSFSPTVDGVTLPDGVMGFRLASAPLNRGVFKTIQLPAFYNVGAFDGMNYGVIQRDGGPDGQLLQFTVVSIDAVVSTP